jgi:tetratricopeptide (TPR) repeat protein
LDSQWIRPQVQALAEGFRKLKGLEGLELLKDCYASVDPKGPKAASRANVGLTRVLAEAVSSSLSSSQIRPAQEFIETSVPLGKEYFYLRMLMDMGLAQVRREGPVDSRQKHEQAYGLEKKGDFQAAAARYQEALAIDEKNDLPMPAVRALIGMGITFTRLGRKADAGSACAQAKALLAKPPLADDAGSGTLYSHLSSVYTGLGQPDEAYDSLTHALEIDRKNFNQNPSAVAIDLISLTASCAGRGKLDEGGRHGEEAVAMCCRQSLADHPFCALAKTNLGDVRKAQSRFREAEQLYQSAVQIFEALQPKAAKGLSTVLEHYSALLQSMGKKREAAAMQERASALGAAASNQPE